MFAMGAKPKVQPELGAPARAPAPAAASTAAAAPPADAPGERQRTHPHLHAAIEAAAGGGAVTDRAAAGTVAAAAGAPGAPAPPRPPAGAGAAPEARPMQLLLDVSLDAPILVLPLNSGSPDHMEIDLGTLLVNNKIVWELRGGVAGGEEQQKVLMDDMRVSHTRRRRAHEIWHTRYATGAAPHGTALIGW